jgi:hypothetical protein
LKPAKPKPKKNTQSQPNELPELPPELIERILIFLPTPSLVRISSRLSKSDLVRTLLRLRSKFRGHFSDQKHIIRASFACGWGFDEDDEDAEDDEAFVLNASEWCLDSKEPWSGDWSASNEELSAMDVLNRAYRRVRASEDFYRGQPVLLPEGEVSCPTAETGKGRKKTPTFRQLVRSYFGSIRVRMVPKKPFRIFSVESRYCPSSIFLSLVDDAKEGSVPRKRHLTGNPGWWDEFQVVEPDPTAQPTLAPTVPAELVATDPLHIGLGIQRPLSDLLGLVTMPQKELAKVATPKGNFVLPFPTSDFCPEERKRFNGVHDGLTFRGWAGTVVVEPEAATGLLDSTVWCVEIGEIQVGLMAMARKVDLEEKAEAARRSVGESA